MTNVIVVDSFEQDIVLSQRSGSTIVITVLDQSNNPITNFMGYTARAQIRDRDDSLIFEWNTTSSSTIGQITLAYDAGLNKSTASLIMTPTQSAVLDFWLARWDCFLTNPAPASLPARIGKGTIALDKATTH